MRPRCAICGSWWPYRAIPHLFLRAPRSLDWWRAWFNERLGVADPGGCREWTLHRDKQGYGVRSTIQHGRLTMMKAHRAAWELAYGPIPEEMAVLHHCDNPACCTPEHLFLGTIADNNRDMWRKGRGRRPPGRKTPALCGEAHPDAKLTAAQVREIRERYAQGGVSQRQLAREYGIDSSGICRLLTRKQWRSVA